MTTAQSALEKEIRDRHYRIGRVLTLTTVALTVGVLYYLVQDFLRAGQPTLASLLYVAGIPAFYYGARLVGRGEADRGTIWLLGSVTLIAVVNTIAVSGQMVFSIIMVFALFNPLALYLFPLRKVGVVLVVVAAIALTIILVDSYWPYTRPQLSGLDQTITNVLGGILIFASAYVTYRGFTNFSLSVKLISSLLVVALFPIGVLALINASSSQRLLIENANRLLRVAAIQTANNLDAFVDSKMADISKEARIMGLTHAGPMLGGEEVTEAAENGILAHLQAFRDNDPLLIQSVAMVNLEGQVLLDTLPANQGRDEAGREYFARAIESGRPTMSAVEFPADGVEPVFYVSAPIFNEEGDVLGLLRTIYKASVLQQMVAQNTGLVGGQSYAILLDENMLQLAHGGTTGQLYRIVAPVDEVEASALQTIGRLPAGSLETLSVERPDLLAGLQNASTADVPFFTVTDEANQENQVAVVSLRNQPWSVAYFQPQSAFLVPIGTELRYTALLGTLVTGLVIAFAVIGSNFLIRPIEQLTAVASQIAQGNLAARTDVHTLDEIGMLATTVNSMAGQLQETLDALEVRVAERTRALETAAQVSRSVSSILDQNELARQVVQQVYEAFDYYYVHIYLLDPKNERLRLVAGNGKPGPAKRVLQHSLNIGKGLVGRAAFLNSPVLVANTEESEEWVYNPDLPETRSEVAVPISIGGEVLGVLDVQEDEKGALQEPDVEVLQTFANQVAVALRNARLFEASQQQAQREAQINEITQRIQQTNDMTTAMQIAIRELGRATGVQAVHVRLHQKPAGNGHEAK